MELKKIAISLPDLLLRAIHDHDKTHFCDPPKRFVLHPEIIKKLESESPWELIEKIPGVGLKFRGIFVESDPLATRPKLISSTNEVVYL